MSESTNNLPSNPLGGLNGLRALACWMVCLYHGAFLLGNYFPAASRVLDWGQEGVYVFFLISALVVPWSMSKMNYTWADSGKFLLKRLIRLYPPFFLSIVGWLVYFGHGGDPISAEVWQKALDTALFLVPIKGSAWVNNLYWTMFVNLQFYLFIALVYPLIANPNALVRRLTLLATLAAAFIPQLFPDYKDIKIMVFFHLPVFTMGILLFLYLKDRIKLMEFALSMILSALVFLYLTNGVYGLGYHIIITTVLTVLAILFLRKMPSWLDFVGQISYSFYLTHGIVLYWINYHFSSYTGTADGALMVYLSIQVLVIVFAWLFYQLIEKPSLGWTKKIKYAAKPGMNPASGE